MKLTFHISKKQFMMLYKEHPTDAKLAKYLNVSRQYIWSLRKRFEVDLKKTKDEKTDRNKIIYSDNKARLMPIIDIAKRHNISKMTVHRILKSMET